MSIPIPELTSHKKLFDKKSRFHRMEGLMATYRKALDILEKILIFFVALFAGAMIIITCVEVFRRYVFSKSYRWSEELCRYMMVTLAFYGGAIAYRHKNLIPLDLITGRLSKKFQVYIETLLEFVSVFILMILFYYSTKTVLSPIFYKQKSIGFPISMAIPYSAMPISFACMFLFAFEHFIDLFRQIRKGADDLWEQR